MALAAVQRLLLSPVTTPPVDARGIVLILDTLNAQAWTSDRAAVDMAISVRQSVGVTVSDE